ncbi:MAG: hypothetical protein BRC26_03075 [Nanohaloarchaea archaeon QH_8_44_6]|nr:MAG: hypothetical protein BRC26_03075 [Nanohaloarchaea archaeon QH_8_44_6]
MTGRRRLPFVGLRNWFRVSKEIILAPISFYSVRKQSEDLGSGLKFGVSSLAFLGAVIGFLQSFLYSSMLAGIFLGTGSPGLGIFLFVVLLGLLGALTGAIGTVIFGILALGLYSALSHVLVRLFGGNKGFSRTFEAFLYSTAVTAFFGWIPVINVFGFLYRLYVGAVGLENFQGISRGKALIAVVAPGIVILGVVFAIIFGAQLAYYSSVA